MKYSTEALYILSMCEYVAQGRSRIKLKSLSNYCFYTNFYKDKNFKNIKNEWLKQVISHDDFNWFMENIKKNLDGKSRDNIYNSIYSLYFSADGIVCVYDKEFPAIYNCVKKAEMPFLLFYKGDINLLRDIQSNVAVIGLVNPDEYIIKRESLVVKKLVENNMNIVSGLARGCDTIAHQVCINNKGKTIAILPSTLSTIHPSQNRPLAENIINTGGLLLTEYYREPRTPNEYTGRLIFRNRLQAMFSKAIILSASYAKGNGDSGSSHAMEKAESYGIYRAMLYNEDEDKNNGMFGLNKEYSLDKEKNIKIITQSVLNDLVKYKPKNYTAMPWICKSKKQAVLS